jgi:hypothetical protein
MHLSLDSRIEFVDGSAFEQSVIGRISVNETAQGMVVADNCLIDFDASRVVRCFGQESRVVVSQDLWILSFGQSSFSYLDIDDLIIELDGCLMTIDDFCFSHSSIGYLCIPNSVERLGSFSFYHSRLTELKFEANSRLVTISEFCLSVSICLLSEIECLSRRSFRRSQLDSFSIASNSALKSLSDCSFEFSSVRSICIPSGVDVISDFCFSYCKTLSIVTFEYHPSLKMLGISCLMFRIFVIGAN